MKYTNLNDGLYQYITECHSRAGDVVLKALRAETKKLGEISRMLISEEQSSFLSLLVAALGVKNAVEVGTFTGCSAISIARGLVKGGKLWCFDKSEEWTGIAARFWQEAGVTDCIELVLGSAAETLPQKIAGLEIDFAFIDADKTGYDLYYETLLPRMKRNGVIVFDNMLWGGKILTPDLNLDGQAINRLNRKLASDPRVESVLIPIADGLHLCRKL